MDKKSPKRLQNAYELFLTYYQVSQLACGIILVESKEISEENLQNMRVYFRKEGTHAFAQYYYDNETGILAILIDDRTLSLTHYQALAVKEYLQERNLLAGQILIASFPENGKSAVQILNDMLYEMSQGTREVGEIRIFNFEAPNAGHKNSILVVNDDVTLNEFLDIYLGKKGYKVTFANDGREGIKKYLELNPDLVITELNLPIIDGYQLISTIRKSSDSEHKIMVLTGKRLEEDIQKSFDMGVSDYMIKPFSPIELEARMKRLFPQNEDKGEMKNDQLL